jgi:hypothetical protein
MNHVRSAFLTAFSQLSYGSSLSTSALPLGLLLLLPQAKPSNLKGQKERNAKQK